MPALSVYSKIVGALLVAGLASVPSIAIAADPCRSPDMRSDNEAWTTNSWKLFNSKAYQAAIENVDACIANWMPMASQTQENFDAKGAQCPPVGAVDGATKKSIFANGLLNDVGTNLWIKARSQEFLGIRDAAKKSYDACAKLRCARTWDERGWFWDPALDCSARLKALR
jgi:hypothetical protein